ncbi:hypothetical protein CKAH01_05079 [Colletotrichum kahawae]|uniref:Uncharacterized protein n=1 Tax=Colletotrichum kahawae TaxID=34407 RepID=A0AAD9YGZ3_COLKA|nr:hypothetical protein CKAH01_05079 [Colletotrichum kahawae]
MSNSWGSNFAACLRASLETAAYVLESLAVIHVNGLGTLASEVCVSGTISQLTFFSLDPTWSTIREEVVSTTGNKITSFRL